MELLLILKCLSSVIVSIIFTVKYIEARLPMLYRVEIQETNNYIFEII
jgi:hypothetical protein